MPTQHTYPYEYIQ